MYCLDDYGEISLFGNENEDFGRLDILLSPCNLGLEPGEVPVNNPTCHLDLKDQMEFLEPLNFLLIYNNQRFNDAEFDSKTRIIKESVLVNQQIDVSKPNWFGGKLRRDQLEDEADYIKLGSSDPVDYLSFIVNKPQISAWTTFPKKYKYTSFEVTLSFDTVITNRETYDFLEYLGDLGGLLEALMWFGNVVMFPIITYYVRNAVASQIFLYKPKKGDSLAHS